MIRFKANFKVYDSPCVGVPKVKPFGDNFWCSFNTKKQLIMCNVVYLGEDSNMQQHKWYSGIIELPYGEKFSPYCQGENWGFTESINIAEKYCLNAGGETIGECELLDIIEIKANDFDVKHHPDGTI